MLDEKCYACVHVLRGERPVLYVCREDGDLIMTCGGDDHGQTVADWKVIHSGHLVTRDENLDGVPELGPNEQAERPRVGASWVTAPLED